MRDQVADDASEDRASEEGPVRPLKLFLTRRNVKQLFNTVPLLGRVRQLLLQLRVNGALRPVRHRTALTPLDPDRLRGSQTRHSHCCKLTIQDPPCLDGLELKGWSIIHAANRSLLIMKTVLVASDSFNTSDDDDQSKAVIPAAVPARPATPASAAARPVAAAVAARPLPKAILAAATQPRPTPAQQAKQAPISQPRSNTESVQRISPSVLLHKQQQQQQQQQQRLLPLPSQPLQHQQPPLHNPLFHHPPSPFMATGKVTVIVSERLTIPIKAMQHLFPDAHFPAPAYIRIQQHDTIGLAHLAVTIAPGPNFKASSRTYVVEGLSAGALCGKAVIGWGRDTGLVRERHAPKGKFSTERLVLLLMVGDPPAGTSIPGDAVSGMAKADLSVAVEHHKKAWKQHLEGGKGSVRINPSENAFLIRTGLPPPGHRPTSANTPLATPSAPTATAGSPRMAAPVQQRQAAASVVVAAAKPQEAAGGASRAGPHTPHTPSGTGIVPSPAPAARAAAAAPAAKAVAAPVRAVAAPAKASPTQVRPAVVPVVKGAVAQPRHAATVTPAATVNPLPKPAGRAQTAEVRQAAPPAPAAAVAAHIPSTAQQAAPPKRKALHTPDSAAAAPPPRSKPAALPSLHQQASPLSREAGAAAAEDEPAQARKVMTPRSKDGVIRSKVSVPMAFAMLHFPRQLVWPMAVALRVCVSGAFDPVEYAVMVQKKRNSYYLTQQPPVIIGKKLIRLQFQDKQIILHMEDPTTPQAGTTPGPANFVVGGAAAVPDTVEEGAGSACSVDQRHPSLLGPDGDQQHQQQQRKRKQKAAVDLAVGGPSDSGASGDSSPMTHQAPCQVHLAPASAKKAKASKASPPVIKAAVEAAVGRVTVEGREGVAGEGAAATQERRAKRTLEREGVAGNAAEDNHMVESETRTAAAAAAQPSHQRVVSFDHSNVKAGKRARKSDADPVSGHCQPHSLEASCGSPSALTQAVKTEAGPSAGQQEEEEKPPKGRCMRSGTCGWGGTFMSVSHPMLQMLWGAGKLRTCRELLLSALELDGACLPKGRGRKRGEVRAVGGDGPELVPMGVLVVAVMQALNSLGLRSSATAHQLMCAHSALSGLKGSSSVFARSAGHAFLCEAMSREDTAALPWLLDELLDMQLCA
ncbi:MAG: hypothetical protein WDW38_007172 [Sanguina aurantia]